MRQPTESPAERSRRLSQEVRDAKEAWRKGGEVGPIKMSRAAFHGIHRDYRSTIGDETHPSCLVLARGGTCLVSVELTDGRKGPLR